MAASIERPDEGSPRRWPWIVLALAQIAFVITAWWFSQQIGVWSEEVSTYPSGPSHALDAGRAEEPRSTSCEGPSRLRTNEHRPELALCAADRTWPIMVAPYMSGWIYWPAGAVLPPDVFLLRKLGLVLGAVTLLLGFLVVRRMADPAVAAAAAAAAALSSPFVLAHGLLVHFELLPLPLVTVAAWLAVRSARGPTLGARRSAMVGLLLGLAVAVNIKALFLIGALVLLGWRTGRLPRFDRRSGAAFGLALATPLVPMIAHALLDDRGGFGGQIELRLRNLGLRLSSPETLLEPLNVLTYWTDVAAYGEQAIGSGRLPHLLPLVLPAAALIRILVHFGRALLGRSHDLLAAVFGALVGCYVLAAALLYDQHPAANYAPLHVVFGLATGSTAVVIARFVAARLALPKQLSAALAVLLVLASVGGFAWHTFRRGDPSRMSISTNAVAQRAAVAHLERSPGGTPVTASYNLAGVIDAVSGGRLEAVHVAPYVTACPHDGDEAATRACTELRWQRTSERLGRMRVLLPVRSASSDESELAEMLPALEALAARGVITLTREATFAGTETEPLLSVWDVRPR